MIRNITLSAEEELIEQAREVARQRKSSLNREFRAWLDRYVGRRDAGQEYEKLMERLDYVKLHPPYTREEMNER